MREALNNNAVAQVVVLAVLAIVVAFLFSTRVLSEDDDAAETPQAPATAASAAIPAPPGAAPAATTAEVPPPVPGAARPAATAEGFVSGPGLPAAVVDAHERGDAVVLLVTRENGIDDRKLEAIVGRLDGSDTSVFSTRAEGIARYSRITQGLDVDRTPALIVVEPTGGGDARLPRASVAYGFRGPESAEQAVRDALYDGRDNLPYYPE